MNDHPPLLPSLAALVVGGVVTAAYGTWGWGRRWRERQGRRVASLVDACNQVLEGMGPL